MDAYPIPTILKLNFPFFSRRFNCFQNRSICALYRQPPIGAKRRLAAEQAMLPRQLLVPLHQLSGPLQSHMPHELNCALRVSDVVVEKQRKVDENGEKD
jgi:hypothetical protein